MQMNAEITAEVANTQTEGQMPGIFLVKVRMLHYGIMYLKQQK